MKRFGWLVAFGLWLHGAIALACPCGCGAVGPLVLWPGEQWKMQVGVNKEYIDGFVDAAGKRGPNGGPVSTDSLQLGVARAITQDVSLSLNAAGTRDTRPGVGNEWGAADPSVGVRYIPHRNDYEKPWLPEVHLHATYKYALDNLRSDETLTNDAIDGQGLRASELVPGVDLWFYLGELALGVGQALEYRRTIAVTDHGGEALRESGLGWRSTLGVSYTLMGWGQMLVNYEASRKGLDALDGVALPDSQRLQHSVGLAVNLRAGVRRTVSLSAKSVGALFHNSNTKRARSFTVSLAQAL